LKFDFVVKPISREDALELIRTYHYSHTMPKITKHYLGAFLGDTLVGVVTLGWGTQPKATIKKLFPSLNTKDYFEIGKMCMLDSMPHNSESQMLSKVIKWISVNLPDCQFLYTWADGLLGKPGYVYQAANFYFGGFIWTDLYMGSDGKKIHPRGTRKILEENSRFEGLDKRLFWMTYDFMKVKGIRRIKGKQFRYIYPLTKVSSKMIKDSPIKWYRCFYPKHEDLQWKEQVEKGKYTFLTVQPEFTNESN